MKQKEKAVATNNGEENTELNHPTVKRITQKTTKNQQKILESTKLSRSLFGDVKQKMAGGAR